MTRLAGLGLIWFGLHGRNLPNAGFYATRIANYFQAALASLRLCLLRLPFGRPPSLPFCWAARVFALLFILPNAIAAGFLSFSFIGQKNNRTPGFQQ